MKADWGKDTVTGKYSKDIILSGEGKPQVIPRLQAYKTGRIMNPLTTVNPKGKVYLRRSRVSKQEWTHGGEGPIPDSSAITGYREKHVFCPILFSCSIGEKRIHIKLVVDHTM